MHNNLSGYHQIYLTRSQLLAGLNAKINWQSGWEYIFEIDMTPEDLETELGIVFEESFDALDNLRVARIEVSSGSQYTLVSYNGRPANGTLVEADLSDIVREDDLIGEFTKATRIEMSRITWRAPTVVPWPRPELALDSTLNQ